MTSGPLADAPLADAPLADAPLADAPLPGAPLPGAPLANAPLAAPLAGAPFAARGPSGPVVLRQRSNKLVERRGAAQGAMRAGADLRAARERLGWTLEAVSDGLRIRLCHLEALEEGDVSQLPGNAYVVGHVRAYARALGLDAPQMVRRFKAEAAAVGRRTELVFPVPMAERGLPAGAAMLVGLVLSVGVYAGWYRLSGEGRLPAETAAAVPERLASLAEQAIPAPAATALAPGVPSSGVPGPGVPGSKAPSPATRPADQRAPGERPPADPSAPADAGAGPASAPGSAAAAAVEAAPPVAAVSPASAAASSVRDPAQDRALVPAAAADAAPAPDAGRILLRATADAWVQVRDRGGATLLNRTLRAGETWPVPERGNLLLTTGNAGATEILVDGAATAGLGPSGAVRRDLPLDAWLAKGGRLAALPPRPVPAPVRQ